MGLDITYHRSVTFLRPKDEDGEYDWRGGEDALYVNPDFVERADGLETGIYRVEGGGGFRAGGYGGYNEWRRQLAEQIGGYTPESAWGGHGGASTPFVELVNFSDCEGVIGPITSAKLARDFAAHRAKADEIGGWFAEQYGNWQTAFEAAADGGVVIFH